MTTEPVSSAEVTKSKAVSTKQQLVEALKRRLEGADQRSDVIKEMYDKEDLSLLTETHAQMVTAKVRMRLLLAAQDPTRSKPLVQVFLEEYNKEMISFERKGRLELLGALQALESIDEERVTRT
jgi:hypothetical protein